MKKKFSFIITFILVISIFLIPNNVFAEENISKFDSGNNIVLIADENDDEKSDSILDEKLDSVDTSVCSDYAMAEFLYIVKTIMTTIKIISPILAIVAFTIYFFKAVINPDDKNAVNSKRFFNIAISLIIIFLLQFLIEFSISIAGYSFNFSNCWINATNIHNQIHK